MKVDRYLQIGKVNDVDGSRASVSVRGGSSEYEDVPTGGVSLNSFVCVAFLSDEMPVVIGKAGYRRAD